MKLGFLTACLPGRSLEESATWAAAEGHAVLEVAAWPALGDRPCTATQHEDPVGGDPEDPVKTGLPGAHRTLSPVLVA